LLSNQRFFELERELKAEDPELEAFHLAICDADSTLSFYKPVFQPFDKINPSPGPSLE
jgi:hypothetical protein